MLADEALSARVEAALVKAFPKVVVDSANGEVFVNVRGSRADEKNIDQKVRPSVGKRCRSAKDTGECCSLYG